jgi:hypothetical protein
LAQRQVALEISTQYIFGKWDPKGLLPNYDKHWSSTICGFNLLEMIVLAEHSSSTPCSRPASW